MPPERETFKTSRPAAGAASVSQPHIDEIHAHLTKILKSDPFSRSQRIQKLLTFLVERTVSGDEQTLKETVIGVEVFDRTPDYDSKADPVVRVEMRRLRSKLSEYYVNEGKFDTSKIWLEKGTYVPSFSRHVSEELPSGPSPPLKPEPPATADLLPNIIDEHTARAGAVPAKHRRKAMTWLPVGVLVLAVTIAFLLRSHSSKITAPGPVFPLTGNAGQEMSPAFSPDSKQIAYSWDGNLRNFDIYVKPVQGGTPRRLTDNAAHDIDPTWSPDGQRLAFLRIYPNKSELILMPATGGVETVLREIATPVNPWHPSGPDGNGRSGPVWSPDGSYLALTSYVRKDSSIGIMKVFLDGHEQALTQAPAGATDTYPSISPSGDFVAFTRTWGVGSCDLFVVPSRGGTPVRLTSESFDIWGSAWLDNDHVLFISNRSGDLRFWSVPRSGGNPQLMPVSGFRPSGPAVSRDGHWLAFVESFDNANIWRVPINIAGNAEASPFISSAGSDDTPAYSPDGKKIAFVSNRSGSWQIWMADSDGTNIRQITDFKGQLVGSVRWSPQGRRLVFDGMLDGRSSIWLMDADGGGLHRVNSSAASEMMPTWSRDGHWIYFLSSRDGHDRLWKQNPESGEVVALTQERFYDATESPDGKLLYIQAPHNGIWQMPIGGGPPRPVPELRGIDPVRYWTIAGNELYFVRQEHSPREIESFNLVTRRFRSLGSIPSDLMAETPGLSVDPSGHWLLFAQKEQRRSSIMLQRR